MFCILYPPEDSRSRLTDVFMAVGSYFIVVRARDIQGGEAGLLLVVS